MRLLVFFILICNISFAQYPLDNKRDHVWMFGYENSPPNFGGTCLNFNLSPVDISYVSQLINIDETDASISDIYGSLLFYTNGMYVANANHLIMPNGDSLNPGDVFNWYGDYGYRLPQGALILPKPESTNLYYILHEKLVWSTTFYQVIFGLYYSVIDMSLDGGLGDVTQKNVLFFEDSLDPGCITATRHANGRDWWIIVPEFLNNRYYKYILSPQGCSLFDIQDIGVASQEMELGQACFSPDGNKYVRWAGTSVNHPNRLEVFDFDRCNGTLSNYQNLWYTDTAWAFGVAISPNSQFMYISADKRIDQYNLNSADIASTRQVVAIYDGFTDPIFPAQTRFFLTQLAPDNRIYVCTPGGTRFLHVIDQPDNEGTSCNVLQHAIQLNTFNSSSMPNFPNYRLGPIDGSVCDSLGINIVTDISSEIGETGYLKIWPNPASQYFNYNLQMGGNDESYIISFTDNLGSTVWSRTITNNQTIGNFDIGEIKNGCYLVIVKNSTGTIIGTRKILVIK